MQRKFLVIVLVAAVSGFVFAQTKIVEFSVLDSSGNFYSDLKISDFQLVYDKTHLSVRSLRKLNRRNLEIVIMIDASASQEKVIKTEKMAAREFIDLVLQKKRDQVAIVKFAGQVSLEQDLTSVYDLAKKKIRSIQFEPPPGYLGGGIVIGQPFPRRNTKTTGSTSLWESLAQVLTAFSKIPRNPKTDRIIFLISDGVNTSGETKLNDVVKISKAAKIPIFALGVGDKNQSGISKKNLKKISSLTGGTYQVLKKKKYVSDFPTRFRDSLSSRYEITLSQELGLKKGKLIDLRVTLVDQKFIEKGFRVIQPKRFFSTK